MSRRVHAIPLARLAPAALLLAGAWLAAPSARAQYATSIPFAPYSSPYQSFSYPTVVNPSLPNQARLGLGPTLGGGVSLDTGPDLLSIDPYGTFNRPTGGRYVPYHAAYRTPDRFTSSYVQRDQDYAANLARRDQLFYLMRAEQDPKRRAELSKELDSVNKALRDASGTRRPRTGPTPATGSTPGAPAAPGPATPNRRTSRGTPIAVPPFPSGTNSARPAPATAAQPPVTPPVAVPRTTPTPGSVDPLEVLNRSRASNPATTTPNVEDPSSAPAGAPR